MMGDMEMGDDMEIKDDMMMDPKKDDEKDSEPPPPDNGPLYCSMCNWLGSMYDRFDNPFVTFFII